MRRSRLARLLPVLLAPCMLVAAGCATSSSRAPRLEERVIRFDSHADLDDWHVTAGEWTVDGGRLVGRSLDPSGGVTDEYATHRTYWGEIERVIVRGGLDAGSPNNFRMAVGAAAQLFNWERTPASWFELGHHDQQVSGALMTPGQEHEIVLEQIDDRIRIVVDDRTIWEHRGRMRGPLTLHPSFGSTLWVREIVIRGRPVPWIQVDGPDVPIM